MWIIKIKLKGFGAKAQRALQNQLHKTYQKTEK
jgi:hypothetical protein